jgi:16S rRNA (cytosine1402-N4)-methyltransferase
VITFHSLEDRIVKQAFVAAAKGCLCPPKLPVCSCGRKPALTILTQRPITTGPDEVAQNPAARRREAPGCGEVVAIWNEKM